MTRADDGELVRTYLARLGLEPEPPSLDALQRLHRAQVERVPYETMWIHAGEPWGIDPRELDGADRPRRSRRVLLPPQRRLQRAAAVAGVRGHAARRRRARPAAAPTRRCSRTTSCSPSPTCRRTTNPSGVWYVDAGLGDALHEAAPAGGRRVRAGAVPPRPGGDRRRGRRLAPHPRSSRRLHRDELARRRPRRWTSSPSATQWLSTSPDSGFVRVATAQRRDATGVDRLRGLVLSRVGVGRHRRGRRSPSGPTGSRALGRRLRPALRGEPRRRSRPALGRACSPPTAPGRRPPSPDAGWPTRGQRP